MASNKFAITLKGDEADEMLRLRDFVDQLGAFKKVLNQIELFLFPDKPQDLYFVISKLTMNSPITVEFEAVSKNKNINYGPKIVEKLGNDLDHIVNGKRPPQSNLELLETYKILGEPSKRHIAGLTLNFNDKKIEITSAFETIIDNLVGPDHIEIGSMLGDLEYINLHHKTNQFKIYPVVGPVSVKCHFKPSLLNDVLAAINRYVSVSGALHYKKGEKFPHFIEVESIENMPDQESLPSFSSLRGMAKGEYGGLSSEKYIERVRNEEW